MKQRMKVPYEKGVAIHSASSLALGIARYSAKRRQRIGGVGIQLRKDAIRTPTSLKCAEGNMNKIIRTLVICLTLLARISTTRFGNRPSFLSPPLRVDD